MKRTIFAVILLAVFFLSPNDCEGYRILGVFPFHVKSHFIMFEALMKGLVDKGHQVDVVSPFPQKKPYPNYTDITLSLDMPAMVNNMMYETIENSFSDMVQFMAEMGNNLCENLGHPKMLKIIQDPPRDPPYDVVITEVIHHHCYMALGYHLRVPVIGVSTSMFYPWTNGIIGNPPNLAFVPNNLVNYVAPMTFWQRLHNTVTTVYKTLYFQRLTSRQDDIIRKYFGEKAPGVREAERSLALILINSHPAINDPRPITPGVIEVGGLHVQDDGLELSGDLKEWMDNSTDGFIYFTFGSMILVETFPEEILRVFYKSLEKIAPIKVLMKIVDPKKLPPRLPKNIRTFKWAPQYKVLKHKNVKAFITHGGLMGTQEAIHCAVPMIGMPLFADQFINVDLYTRKKIAVSLSYKELTEAKMDKALNDILFNPIYKNTIRKVSEKFLDRPMTAMETATWWVQYVIRHGSNALRSPAVNLTWWQIELVDVYAFLLSIGAISLFIVFTLIRSVIKILFKLVSRTVTHSKKVE